MRTSPRRADFSDTQPLPLAADELRRRALLRSQQRGQRVARRRLAWRWSLWFLGRALRLSVLPLAVLAICLAGAWWWLNRDVATPLPPPAAAASASQTQAAPAASSALAATSDAAASLPVPDLPADPPAAGALPLRLDDSEAVPAVPAHAQSDTPPNDDDRRSRERP